MVINLSLFHYDHYIAYKQLCLEAKIPRWLSSRIMADYDVNEEEWKEDGSPVQAGLRPMRWILTLQSYYIVWALKIRG